MSILKIFHKNTPNFNVYIYQLFVYRSTEKPPDDPIEDEPLLTPSSNDSAIVIESNGPNDILRTIPNTTTSESENATEHFGMVPSASVGNSPMKNDETDRGYGG